MGSLASRSSFWVGCSERGCKHNDTALTPARTAGTGFTFKSALSASFFRLTHLGTWTGNDRVPCLPLLGSPSPHTSPVDMYSLPTQQVGHPSRADLAGGACSQVPLTPATRTPPPPFSGQRSHMGSPPARVPSTLTGDAFGGPMSCEMPAGCLWGGPTSRPHQEAPRRLIGRLPGATSLPPRVSRSLQ